MSIKQKQTNKKQQYKESMKQRFWFFEKINKVEKSLAKLTKIHVIFKFRKLKMKRDNLQQTSTKFREP